MPTHSSTEADYIPPSLRYLVIYNPTLRPPPSEQDTHDDDDAIEQSHILFYTASQRAVARDQMLRQVGLAKALNSFSEMFSTDACESVHSQKTRLVMIEPEPDFWMLASIDVPRTARRSRSKEKAATFSKSRSGDKKPGPEPAAPDEWEYRENVLFDGYLRTYMQRGYEDFKLLYGSFAALIAKSSRVALEKLLEKHFTTWSWNWDVNHLVAQLAASNAETSTEADGPDFPEHLGVPLHPSTSTAAASEETTAMLQRLHDLAPSPFQSMALCLQPPSIFSSRSTPSELPPSLARYLLSTIPSPAASGSKTRRTSGASNITVRRPQSTGSQPVGEAAFGRPSSAPTGFLPPLGKLNMGVTLGNMTSAANPKKWTWPGYLTFGRGGTPSAASSRDPSPSSRGREGRPPAPSLTAAVKTDEAVPAVTLSQPTPAAETALHAELTNDTPRTSPASYGPESTVAVDQESLDDAISVSSADGTSHQLRLEDGGGDADNAPILGEDVHDSTSATPDSPSSPDVKTPKASGRLLNAGSEPAHPDAVADDADSSQEDSVVEQDEAPVSPVQKATSSQMTVHLDATPGDGTTVRNRLIYYVRGRVVFAVVLDSEADEVGMEDGLHDQVDALLGELGEALDRWTIRSEEILIGRSQPVSESTAPTTNITGTRHVVRDVGHGVTTCSTGFESTSPHFFTAKQVLSRFPNMSELISRTDSLRWFSAKRCAGDEIPDGGMTEDGSHAVAKTHELLEVYAEVGRKDASLVDVGREVEGILHQR